MNDKNKNLIVRVVSALVLLPLVLWLVWKGQLWSAGLMGFAAAVCAGEYYLIVFKRLSPAHLGGMLGAGLWPLYPALFPGMFASWALWTGAVVFFFGWIYHLLRGPVASAPERAAHLWTGMAYGAFGMTALAAVRLEPHGLSWVTSALIITWANDTCAYFAGRFLGRRKLYAEVSPNKTWEGFFGGMLGSIAGMFIGRAFFFPNFAVVDCLLLGLGGGLLGPLGDLCESMLKRAYQVKDSGKIIPGHGGLLDRVDALLFNAPLVFLYVTFFRGLLSLTP